MERLGRTADPVGHDYQPAAMQQRAPQLPHGEVEGERVVEGPHVVGVEAVPGVGRVEQSRHVGMRDRDALWLSGGTGRVDDVREVLRAGAALGILRCSRARSRRRRCRDEPRRRREAAGPGAAAPAPTITETPESSSRNPSRSGWIRGIEGQIRASGLQDPEDANDQVSGAFDAQANQDVWPDAEALRAGGPVGSLARSAPRSEAPSLEDDGLGVGRARHLRLEAAMQGRGHVELEPSRRPSPRGSRSAPPASAEPSSRHLRRRIRDDGFGAA